MEAIIGVIVCLGGLSTCCVYRCCCRQYDQLVPPGATNALREEWGQPVIVHSPVSSNKIGRDK